MNTTPDPRSMFGTTQIQEKCGCTGPNIKQTTYAKFFSFQNNRQQVSIQLFRVLLIIKISVK